MVKYSSLNEAGPVKASSPDYTGVDVEFTKADLNRLYRKIAWRLLPLFWFMTVLCYVDRTNLAFAAIQLNQDLNFTAAVYGLGSGFFFLGYSSCQIPSNLILRVVGGRVWITIVIASWAVVATSFCFMKTATQFYILRLLLGITEAGAFPGMWYYLTTWFGDSVTLPFAVVESGIAVSHVIAAPLAAACLSLNGIWGLTGWQWLFILEGIPSLILAGVMAVLLPSTPESASWLTCEEKQALARNGNLQSPAAPAGEQQGPGGPNAALEVSMMHGSASASTLVRSTSHGSGGGGVVAGHHGHGHLSSPGTPLTGWQLLCQAASNKYVWYMGGIKFTRDISSFGIIFFAPTIINAVLHEAGRANGKVAHQAVAGAAAAAAGPGAHHGGHIASRHGHGVGDEHSLGLEAVLLTAIPFALAAGVAMYLAHRSQQAGERIYHVAIPYIVTGLVFAMFPIALKHSAVLAFMTLTFGIVGVYSGSAASLAMLSELAAGPALVVALPMYNSLGCMGGFVGPSVVGILVESSNGSFGLSTTLMGLALSTAGVMIIGLGTVVRNNGRSLARVH